MLKILSLDVQKLITFQQFLTRQKQPPKFHQISRCFQIKIGTFGTHIASILIERSYNKKMWLDHTLVDYVDRLNELPHCSGLWWC